MGDYITHPQSERISLFHPFQKPVVIRTAGRFVYGKQTTH